MSDPGRKPLPYARQSIDDDDVEAVAETLRSEFLTTGPKVDAFERALEHVTGAPHAVVLNSGTSALHAAYAAAGVGPGDEIVTTPLTFAATATAAVYLGARPVFVDIEPDTGLMDSTQVEAAITERTKAIVAIDYAGQPADYDALRPIATRHGLALIADAAHSLGASDGGRLVGTLADQTVLSFHPVKVITAAEGGAVLASDDAVRQRVRDFRSHGIVRDSNRLRQSDGPWYYEVQSLGYNYRLSDLHAALGLSQLRKLDRFLARRRAIAREYSTSLAELPTIDLPDTRPGVDHAWHLYVIRARGGRAARSELYKQLRAGGLGVQVHYVPVHHHPLYRDMGYVVGQFPKAEAFYDSALSIPMYPGLTDADVARVIEDVRATAERL